MQRFVTILGLLLLAAACKGGDAADTAAERGSGGSGGHPGGPGSSRGGPGGNPFAAGGGGQQPAAVPVEVAAVELRSISSYIETNGVLEAENEADIVARTTGPIVELNAEEGMRVAAGDLMARIDDSELQAQLEIARVELNESRLAHERALKARKDDLIPAQEYEASRARYDAAQAQIDGNEVQLGFTRITAPFDGLVSERYVKFAAHVTSGMPLFRLTDFDPLLCKIQVPERDLPALAQGQRAGLEVEAWPGDRFDARVLRISPVVDSATGTIRVTLEVRSRGKLRPGMFSKVFVETAVHDGVRVVPRRALTLDSIGDTVFVAQDGVARRRDVELGFREGDGVEIVAGLEAGEQVVVVGQDGLSDGTPIQVLDGAGAARPDAGAMAAGGPRTPGAGAEPRGGAPGPPSVAAGARGARAAGGPPGAAPGGGRSKRPDFSQMTPEQLERAKQFMRQRGMTEEQIEERIRRARERSATQ